MNSNDLTQALTKARIAQPTATRAIEELDRAKQYLRSRAGRLPSRVILTTAALALRDAGCEFAALEFSNALEALAIVDGGIGANGIY